MDKRNLNDILGEVLAVVVWVLYTMVGIVAWTFACVAVVIAGFCRAAHKGQGRN